MSLKSKRICKCCGKEYEYCPHCGSNSDEMWKNLTDTKECLAVFNIVAAFNVGRANADQVKNVLKENNITDYSAFKESIVSTLDKVCKPVDVPTHDRTAEKPRQVVEVAPAVIQEHINIAEEKNPEIEIPTITKTEVQSTPRKSRGKKKHRTRNADIEL